jgi:hypothetical protein
MPASLVELVVEGGLPQFKCPVSGVGVFDGESGFDPSRAHSPYLRFFIDWVGEVFVAASASVPKHQRQYMEAVRAIWEDAGDDDQNERVARCCAALPPSAVVFEVLDPPGGSSDGEICYACFDFDQAEKSPAPRLEQVG